MAEVPQYDVHHEIRLEVRAQFIEKVVLDECTPEEACHALGIPYEMMLAYKDRDPKVAAIWDYQADRADQKKRLEGAGPKNFKEVTEIQGEFTRALFERAGLGAKIIRYVEKIDPETEKGEEQVEKLLKYGVLKQVLPNQSVQHKPKAEETDEDSLKKKTTAQLLREHAERQQRLNQLLGEHEEAQRARERHTARIEEADVDHS